jgi:hypothetical protein
LTGEVLFRGRQEQDQIQLIYSLCGSELYEEADSFKYYEALKPQTTQVNRLRKHFYEKIPSIQESSHILDFLEKLLAVNPKDRMDVE